MNERFPVLSTISGFLKVVGWFVVIAAAIFIFYEGIYEPSLPRHRFGVEDTYQIILGLSVWLVGLLTVAFSELIRVILAIEENTRTKEQ